MKNPAVRKTVLLLVSFAALAAGLFAWRITLPPQVPAEQLEKLGLILFEQPRRLPAFELPATRGGTVTNSSLTGRWTVLFFGFTHCPDVCPTTMADAAAAWNGLAQSDQSRLQFWLVSVDPERDRPDHLKQYVEHFHPRMLGVTGEVPQLAAFARMFNAVFARVPGPQPNYQVDHSAHLALVSPAGEFVGILRPPVRRESLRGALQLLLQHYPFQVAARAAPAPG